MAKIVNISGTGSVRYCYATVNGTKYISSAQNITLTSNTIVFGVYGDRADHGKVTIDGEVLLSAKNNATETYTWVVPDDVTEVNIVLGETDYESTYVTVTTSSGGGSGGDSGGGSTELPSGYTRLEYIRSSGAQYINTEFNPKYNTRVVMKISDVDTSIDNQWFFGARDGTTASTHDRFTLYKLGETVRSDYFGTSVTVDVPDFTGSTTLDKNGNVASLYGKTITNTTVGGGSCDYPIFLFVLNNAGKPHSNYASYSLESCQIYDGSTLVRNFIPCTNASGAVGLYDLVNSKFYANAGNGTFTAGPEVETNPMAPYDGHNTNIGSMAREIEGGTVKMNGVARELESGLVLVSGVAREISFGGGTVVITITGNGGNYANVQINGRTYTSAMVVEVETGTEAVFSATSQNGITRNITLNGTVVASNSTSSPVTYTMEVIENITVELKYERVVANTYRGVVNITTE